MPSDIYEVRYLLEPVKYDAKEEYNQVENFTKLDSRNSRAMK